MEKTLRTNNIVVLNGEVTDDFEVKKTANSQFCMMNIKTEDSFRFEGKTIKANNFNRARAWGKLAFVCAQNLKKGSKVSIKGTLKTDRYTHEGEKKYTTYVHVNQIKLPEPKEQ